MYTATVADKSRRHAANQDCDAGIVGHNDLKNKIYDNIMTKPELVVLSEPSCFW